MCRSKCCENLKCCCCGKKFPHIKGLMVIGIILVVLDLLIIMIIFYVFMNKEPLEKKCHVSHRWEGYVGLLVISALVLGIMIWPFAIALDICVVMTCITRKRRKCITCFALFTFFRAFITLMAAICMFMFLKTDTDSPYPIAVAICLVFFAVQNNDYFGACAPLLAGFLVYFAFVAIALQQEAARGDEKFYAEYFYVDENGDAKVGLLLK